MWELPLIGHFFYLCQTTLNMPEVSQYELERILVMPQASSLLPKIMTSLLSNPQQRSCLDRKPAMPYKVWHCRLQGRIQSWYKTLQARDYRGDLVFQQLGIEAKFFKILGSDNPLNEKQFHELSFHQRVWCIKGLCDYILHNHRTIQDTMNDQVIDDMREYILGCDSKGNTYLHFPQFCGQDLRIYRQRKCTKPPSPSYWGATSNKKRKIDESGDPPSPSTKKPKSGNSEPGSNDEISVLPIDKQKSASAEPEQNEESSVCSSKSQESATPEPPSESQVEALGSCSPIVCTRRSLRLSKAKLGLEKLEIDELYRLSNNKNEDSSEEKDDKEEEEASDDETGSESETEEIEVLEPDIAEFELVVDSVESLRTFMDQFKVQESSKKIKQSSRRKSEAELHKRLKNLLTELEPWEVKLQKAAQRVRNRLRREWESFEEKEEEIEDIWGSDREESESRQSSGMPSGSSSANEGGSSSDEDCIIPSQQEKRPERMRPKLHLAQKADISTEDLLNQDDDSCEYRTRGRLRHLKHLHDHPEAALGKTKNKKVALNGSRQEQKFSFLRICSSQNTTLQARELYAWETLRQILVPPSNSKEAVSAAQFHPLQASENGVTQSTLNSLLDENPTKTLSVPEKHNLFHAKMDMLGAMKAATLMAKKVDLVKSNDQKPSGSPIVSSETSLLVKSAGAIATIVAKNDESVKNNNLLLAALMKTSGVDSTKTAGNCQKSSVAVAAAPSPPQLTAVTSKVVPTKQHLSDLTSVAENTQNLKKLLQLANLPSTSASSSEKSPKTVLLPMVGPNGKPVMYRLTTNNASVASGAGKLQPGVQKIGNILSASNSVAGHFAPAAAPPPPTSASQPPKVFDRSVSKATLPSRLKVPYPTTSAAGTPQGMSSLVQRIVAPASLVAPSVRPTPQEQPLPVRPAPTFVNADLVNFKPADGSSDAEIQIRSVARGRQPSLSSPVVAEVGKNVQGTTSTSAVSSGGQQMLLIPLPNQRGRNLYLQIPSPVTASSPGGGIANSSLKSATVTSTKVPGPVSGQNDGLPNVVPSNFLTQAIPSSLTAGTGAAVRAPPIKSVISRTQRLIPALSARKRAPPFSPEALIPDLPPLAPFINVARSPASPSRAALPTKPQFSELPRTQLMTSATDSCPTPSVSSEHKLTPGTLKHVNATVASSPCVGTIRGITTPALSRPTSVIMPNAASPSRAVVVPSTVATQNAVGRSFLPTTCTSAGTSFTQSRVSASKGATKVSAVQSAPPTHASPSKGPAPGLASGAKQAAESSSGSSASISIASLIANNPTLAATIQKYTQSGYRVMISQQGENVVLQAIPPAAASNLPQLQGTATRTAEPPKHAQPQLVTATPRLVLPQQQQTVPVPQQAQRQQPPSIAILQKRQPPVVTARQVQLPPVVPNRQPPVTAAQQVQRPPPGITGQTPVVTVRQVQQPPVVTPQQVQHRPVVTNQQVQRLPPTTTQQVRRVQQPTPPQLASPVLRQQADVTPALAPVCNPTKVVDSLQTVVSELGLDPAAPLPTYESALGQMTLPPPPLSATVPDTQSPVHNLIQNPMNAPTSPIPTLQQGHCVAVNCLEASQTLSVVVDDAAIAASQPRLVMIRETNSNKQMLGLLLDNGQVIPIDADVTFTTAVS